MGVNSFSSNDWRASLVPAAAVNKLELPRIVGSDGSFRFVGLCLLVEVEERKLISLSLCRVHPATQPGTGKASPVVSHSDGR